MRFPAVLDKDKVSAYPAEATAGGGLVWDAVLECRVWCSPRAGAADKEGGNDYCCVFGNYREALKFSRATTGAEELLALILQEEYISEDQPGQYVHIRERRFTEWPVEFLSRSRRTSSIIQDFLSPNEQSAGNYSRSRKSLSRYLSTI
jgi:hypothetical protein